MFNITANLSILLTIKVIINFDRSNSLKRSFLHHKLFSLTTQDGNSNLVCGPQFNGLCIFNITRNVSICLTIRVIISYDRFNKLERSFLHPKWFSLMITDEMQTWFPDKKSLEVVFSISPEMSAFC